MNNPLPAIIANLKASNTWDQIDAWIENTSKELQNFPGTVIFCPSSPFLAESAKKIKNIGTKIALGAQDVSKFDQGAYTGEYAASQIKGIVAYCIVGHSERRKYFNETNNDTFEKIKRLLESQITPILCISDESQLDHYLSKGTFIKDNIANIIFASEPPSAISGGGDFHPDTPENANKVCKKIKEKVGENALTIYGGSINPDNVAEFFSQPEIKGALIGQASVNPDDFVKVLQNAQSN